MAERVAGTLEDDMRRVVLSATAGILLAMSSAASALAAPPEKFTEPATFISPDFDIGLVIFINMDRETYCTAERVAWEVDFLAWLEGGQVGDPPEFPGEPAGFDPVSFLVKETRQGALVQLVAGSRLYAEIWEMDPDAPGIGPCTDSDDVLNRLGTGTARFMANDNDLFGSGTRGNAFGNRGVLNLVDENGDSLRYSFKFHVNSRCHFDEAEEAPRCQLIDASLR